MGNGKKYEMKTIGGDLKVFNGTEEEVLQQVKDVFSQLRAQAPKESNKLTLKLACRPTILSYIITEGQSVDSEIIVGHKPQEDAGHYLQMHSDGLTP